MRNAAMMLVLAVVGCGGPMGGLPVVERLNPQDQRTVDQSWLNMLSPPERLDRALLLDVLVTNQLHQQGVDRLHFVSEKDVWGGRVIMTVHYDRAHPAFDNFTVTFTDAKGQERRHERYSFDEVKDRANKLLGSTTRPSTQPATIPAEIEQQRKAEEEEAARLARQILIQVATRPAGQPIDASEIVPR